MQGIKKEEQKQMKYGGDVRDIGKEFSGEK
jgi:hypothetical protein